MKCPKCTNRLRNAYVYAGTSISQVSWVYCVNCEVMINHDFNQREIEEFFRLHINPDQFKARIKFIEQYQSFEINGPKEIEIFPIYLHLKLFLNYSWKVQLQRFIEPIIEGIHRLQKLKDLTEL